MFAAVAVRLWKRRPFLLLVAFSQFLALPAFAGQESPQSFTFQGQLTDTSGAPLTGLVDLTFGLYNPAGTCLLYEETVSSLDLTPTTGLFSVSIGSGTRTGND